VIPGELARQMFVEAAEGVYDRLVTEALFGNGLFFGLDERRPQPLPQWIPDAGALLDEPDGGPMWRDTTRPAQARDVVARHLRPLPWLGP
jgi:hypothetical protein